MIGHDADCDGFGLHGKLVCDGELRESAEEDEGVVFVDPSMNSIVSQSFFNNKPYPYRYLNHPLDSSVMRCIRQISFRDTKSKDLRNYHFNQFSKTHNKKNSSSLNDDNLVNNSDSEKKKRKWGRDVDGNVSSRKRRKYTKQFTTLSSYLCTGYDVYMTKEPNTFTAMAMLHSRVGRVFYLNENPKYGAVRNNTRVQLHTLKGINHRFRVFKCAKP